MPRRSCVWCVSKQPVMKARDASRPALHVSWELRRNSFIYCNEGPQTSSTEGPVFFLRHSLKQQLRFAPPQITAHAYSHHVVSGTLAVHPLSTLGDIVDLSVDRHKDGELRVATVELLKLLEGVHLLGGRERRGAVRLLGVVLDRGALAEVQRSGEEVGQERQEDEKRQQAAEERLAVVAFLMSALQRLASSPS